MNNIRRYQIGLALCLITLTTTACRFGTNLSIENGTEGWLDVTVEQGATVTLEPTYTKTNVFFLRASAFVKEAQDVSVEMKGLYRFSGTETYTIIAGNNHPVTIEADGGAVLISNYTTTTISNVSIVKSDLPETAATNVLPEPIASGDYYVWTVASGTWSIEVKTITGDTYRADEQGVVLDTTLALTVDDNGFRETQTSPVPTRFIPQPADVARPFVEAAK